jgi:hypothetical protein
MHTRKLPAIEVEKTKAQSSMVSDSSDESRTDTPPKKSLLTNLPTKIQQRRINGNSRA